MSRGFMKKFPVTIIKKHGIAILLQAEITKEFKREIRDYTIINNDGFFDSASFPRNL